MLQLNKKIWLSVGIFAAAILIWVTPASVFAATCDDGTKVSDQLIASEGEQGARDFCGSKGFAGSSTGGGPAVTLQDCQDPEKTKTEIVKCKEEFQCEADEKLDSCINRNPIVKTLRTVVNFLSVGVGIVVVAMIVVAGIQFASSGDDPEKAAKAKRKITNALIALLAYIFLGSFLQWVIPGGLF